MRAFVRAVLVAMILTIVASGPSHAVLWGRIDRPAMPQSGVPSDLPADVREAVQCLYTNGRVSESIEGMHRYALSVLRNAGQNSATSGKAIGLNQKSSQAIRNSWNSPR